MAEETPTLLPSEVPLAPRTDLWIAAVFLVIGLSIAASSWVMPRFKEQKGEIYTAPGLVPGIYAVIILILGVWLAWRSIGRGALAATSSAEAAPGDSAPADAGNSNWRLAIAAALCLLFVIGFVGRMPFWLAAAIFVTLFILVFEWDRGLSPGQHARGLATALLQGLITGALVVAVFEKIFYVRLP